MLLLRWLFCFYLFLSLGNILLLYTTSHMYALCNKYVTCVCRERASDDLTDYQSTAYSKNMQPFLLFMLASNMKMLRPVQYREAGVLLCRGFGLQEIANQCFGNKCDNGKGRQMPAHYGSRKHNYFTVASTVA